MTFLGPASLRSRFKKAPRPEWKVADAFRQWLRGRECACRGRNPDCGGPMRSAHVDHGGKGTADAKGMGTKAADKWCIPLTDNCHKLQHAKGWPWFEATILRGNAEALAAEYWNKWPGRARWEADQRA